MRGRVSNSGGEWIRIKQLWCINRVEGHLPGRGALDSSESGRGNLVGEIPVDMFVDFRVVSQAKDAGAMVHVFLE